MVEFAIWEFVLIMALALFTGAFFINKFFDIWRSDTRDYDWVDRKLDMLADENTKLNEQNLKLREENELLTRTITHHCEQYGILDRKLYEVKDELKIEKATSNTLRNNVRSLCKENEELKEKYGILDMQYMRAKQRLNAVYGSLAFKSTCCCECVERAWLEQRKEKMKNEHD